MAEELQRAGIELCGITETHMTGQGEMPLGVGTGYTLLYSGGDRAAAAGVGLAITHDARKAITVFDPVSDRVMRVDIMTSKGLLSVIVAYAPTEQASDETKDDFYRDLQGTCMETAGKAVVLGDFNARIGRRVEGVTGRYGLEGETSDNGDRVIDLCQAHELMIANTMFRHRRVHTVTWYPPNTKARGSLKDYVMVRRGTGRIIDTRARRGPTIDSDHCLVTMDIQLRPRPPPADEDPRLDRTQLELPAVLEQFQEEVRRAFGERAHGSAEARWQGYKQGIMQAARQTMTGGRVRAKPWITAPTMDLVERKRECWLAWQRYREDAAVRQQYRDSVKAVAKAVRADERRWWYERTKDIEDDAKRHRQGDMYAKLRRLGQQQSKPADVILDEGGKKLQREDEKLDRWARHFQGVLNVQRDIDPQQTQAADNAPRGQPITREEVAKAVGRLRNHRATGDDQIAAEYLKAGPEEMTEWLHEVISEVWATGEVPQEWKDATLVPLHKKKDRRVCDNYRGISLLSIPGKVLANVVLGRIRDTVEARLREEQCGFRRGRGTMDQIWLARQLIEKAVEHGTELHMCFVDLAKAYDSVPRAALVRVLREYGIEREIVQIIDQIHTGTGCRVRTRGGKSARFGVATGVRQGCVMSPVLFNVYIDMIVRQALTGTSAGVTFDYRLKGNLHMTYRSKPDGQVTIPAVMYADDMALVATTPGALQTAVTQLDDTCRRWGMQISTGKTEVMAVGGPGADIHIRGEKLTRVSQFTYLGSTLDATGSITAEVDRRITRAGMAFGRWRQRVFRNRALDLRTKMQVFRTVVMTTLLYGSETWAMTNDQLRRLTTFHMRCIREILGVTRWDQIPNADNLARAREAPIGEQIRQRRLQWLGHLERMDPSRPQHKLLRSKLHGVTRPPGGTKQRWIDTIAKDLKDTGILDFERAVQDRPRWRKRISCRLPTSPPRR